MRKDILEKIPQILSWIEEKRSKAFMCMNLKCKPDTLDSFLKKHEIIYAGNQGSVGYKWNHNQKTPVSNYLTKNGLFITSHKLKLKLIAEGIKEEKCEECKKTKWLGEKIPLELHHEDGDRYNNEIGNLKVLCPNCHSLTPNNSGKGCRKV